MQRDPDQVIAEFGPALARVAASYERNWALREELLQEILLAVVRALPKLRDDTQIKPFVFRIAHNRSVSHVTQQMRERRADQAMLDPEEAQPVALMAPGAEPETELLEAVRELTLPYRQVITLLLEGLSYEEIAGALGITVSNVGVRVNRAKTQLKAKLNP